MPLMAFLLQCTPALCCFSVMLHNVWHLGGGASPLPPNLPLDGDGVGTGQFFVEMGWDGADIQCRVTV